MELTQFWCKCVRRHDCNPIAARKGSSMWQHNKPLHTRARNSSTTWHPCGRHASLTCHVAETWHSIWCSINGWVPYKKEKLVELKCNFVTKKFTQNKLHISSKILIRFLNKKILWKNNYVSNMSWPYLIDTTIKLIRSCGPPCFDK